MSSERESDRLEIIELTQTLSQERKKRDVEKQLIDELKQQVRINFGYGIFLWSEQRYNYIWSPSNNSNAAYTFMSVCGESRLWQC